MDIEFSCSKCGQKIVVDEAGAGVEIACPSCQTTLVIPSPQTETLVILTQLCPKCERAWPEHELVCDHCGTPLKESPRTTSSSRPKGVHIELPPRPENMPPPKPLQQLTATTWPAVAGMTAVVAAPASIESFSDEPQYECTSDKCGRIWSHSQLAYQQIGRKNIPVCPHCRLGVIKLTKPLNFWAHVPKAFVYPFKGIGVWILVLGAPLFTLATSVGFGIILLIPKLVLFGYFGMMLINVIRTTAENEEEPLDWPSLEDRMEFVLVGLQIILSTLLIFGPGILCAFQAGISIFGGDAEDSAVAGVWGFAAMGLFFLGVLYYPMGLLGMAMFDSIKGVNPLLIIPAILKTPLHYTLVLVLLAALWLVRIPLGLLTGLFHFPWSMGVVLVTDGIILYTLVVSARLLGLLYRANTERIGWFN